MLTEIRFHGRGGQGAVTAAELLAKAAANDGKYVQAFPSFGPERTGAPVKAFCRIDSRPVTLRSQIYNPDFVVVLDQSLIEMPEVVEGLKPQTVIVINSGQKPKVKSANKIYNIDVTKLAVEALGRPIVNTAMLGAFIKISKAASLGSVLKVIDEKFSGKVAELNKKLVSTVYEKMEV